MFSRKEAQLYVLSRRTLSMLKCGPVFCEKASENVKTKGTQLLDC